MKRLSISQARGLIKRELGLSAASLTAPSDMNENPEYPWFELHVGTQRIDVYTNNVVQGKYTDMMIALSVTHENSNKGTTEYFFGDTLEYTHEYTDWKNRESFCESMEDPEDLTLQRLKREAQDESWKHFHGQIRQNIQTTKTDNIPITGKLTEKQELEHQQIMEQAAWDNFQGKLLHGHDLFKIRVYDLYGKPYSETGPFDETQMKWWMNEVTRGVNNNPGTTSGWVMYQWDHILRDWRPYSIDGDLFHGNTLDEKIAKAKEEIGSGTISQDIKYKKPVLKENGPEMEK